MSPPRFVHKRISHTDFNAELKRQGMSLATFTRLWCQNLSKTKRWANGQEDIPTWVPIALTMMTLPDGPRTARIAAAAMIEKDTLNPHLGDFPYLAARQMPDDDDEATSEYSGAERSTMETLTPSEHRAKHQR